MDGIVVALVLLAFGFFFGRRAEKKHYKSIKKRESAYRSKPVVSGKTALTGKNIAHTTLAVGSVVISVDRFKLVVSGIQNMLGGEVHAFSSLLDRGRREAILRMMESAPNADGYYNFKIETSTISGNSQGVGTVEVMAYSTAVLYQKSQVV